LSSETFRLRRMVVHFTLDKRKPEVSFKNSAINDFSCSFTIFFYNIRMQQRDILIRKLQSATAYLDAIQEKYEDNEAPLELVQPLHVVVSVLQETRREVLLQELSSVLHNEDLPAATRNKKVATLFQLLA
jgi:hypothetical protein